MPNHQIIISLDYASNTMRDIRMFNTEPMYQRIMIEKAIYLYLASNILLDWLYDPKWDD